VLYDALVRIYMKTHNASQAAFTMKSLLLLPGFVPKLKLKETREGKKKLCKKVWTCTWK